MENHGVKLSKCRITEVKFLDIFDDKVWIRGKISL